MRRKKMGFGSKKKFGGASQGIGTPTSFGQKPAYGKMAMGGRKTKRMAKQSIKPSNFMPAKGRFGRNMGNMQNL